VREFVEKELMPNVHEWDEAGDYPMELHEKAYKAGILAAMFPKGITNNQ
jgi:acyl-CoA dehydrogenase